jgi:hypothetical protein
MCNYCPTLFDLVFSRKRKNNTQPKASARITSDVGEDGLPDPIPAASLLHRMTTQWDIAFLAVYLLKWLGRPSAGPHHSVQPIYQFSILPLFTSHIIYLGCETLATMELSRITPGCYYHTASEWAQNLISTHDFFSKCLSHLGPTGARVQHPEDADPADQQLNPLFWKGAFGPTAAAIKLCESDNTLAGSTNGIILHISFSQRWSMATTIH